MPGMAAMGKLLIFFGLILIAVGGLFWLAGYLPGLGRLPGDILIKRGNFTFYFPIVTSLLLSILLSVILSLILRRH